MPLMLYSIDMVVSGSDTDKDWRVKTGKENKQLLCAKLACEVVVTRPEHKHMYGTQ
jgi:hypothetical protein